MDAIAEDLAVVFAANGKPERLRRQIREGRVRHPEMALKLLDEILAGGKATARPGGARNLWPAIIAATYIDGRTAMGASQTKAIKEIEENKISGLRDERDIRRRLDQGRDHVYVIEIRDFILYAFRVWAVQHPNREEAYHQALKCLLTEFSGVLR